MTLPFKRYQLVPFFKTDERAPDIGALDVLHDMRKLLADGWVQDHFCYPLGNGQFSYCLLGAWRMACGGNDKHNHLALSIVGFLLPPSKYEDHRHFTRWNDNLMRTRDEVLGVVDKAIAMLSPDIQPLHRPARKRRGPFTAAQVLQRTKNLIRDEARWTRGSFKKLSADGYAYCIVGAWSMARGTNKAENKRALQILHALANQSEKLPASVVTWNDARRRTHEEVMAFMDQAIKMAEQDKSPVLEAA